MLTIAICDDERDFREYLADLKEQVDQYQNIYQTGNPYLDILLRD